MYAHCRGWVPGRNECVCNDRSCSAAPQPRLCSLKPTLLCSPNPLCLCPPTAGTLPPDSCLPSPRSSPPVSPCPAYHTPRLRNNGDAITHNESESENKYSFFTCRTCLASTTRSSSSLVSTYVLVRWEFCEHCLVLPR